MSWSYDPDRGIVVLWSKTHPEDAAQNGGVVPKEGETAGHLGVSVGWKSLPIHVRTAFMEEYWKLWGMADKAPVPQQR